MCESCMRAEGNSKHVLIIRGLRFKALAFNLGGPKQASGHQPCALVLCESLPYLAKLTSISSWNTPGIREEKSPYVIQGLREQFPAAQSNLIALGDILHAVARFPLVYSCSSF